MSDDDAVAERLDLEEEASRDEVALNPSETGDPVDWDTYSNHSQRHRDVAVGDA